MYPVPMVVVVALLAGVMPNQSMPPRPKRLPAQVADQLQRPYRPAMVNAVKIDEVFMRPAPELGDTLLVYGRWRTCMAEASRSRVVAACCRRGLR